MTTSLHRDRQRTFLTLKKSTRRSSQEISSEREEWVTQANCRQGDPDALFVRGAQQRKAAAACRNCRVQEHCLATALDNREGFGVWGGLTERQRRALLRKNSHIKDWARHLASGGEVTGI